MRSPRRLSVMGALLLGAGVPTMLFTAQAHAAPHVETSPAASPSPSESATVAELGLAEPDQVVGLTAGTGDGTLMLSFTAPGNGGSVITGYDYSTDNGANWKPLAGVTGTTTKQATISHESVGDGTGPLGYNIPYNLKVRAVNDVGPGTASDAYSATIPPKAPDAPGPVSTDVEDGAITLSFAEPRDYGSSITGWEYSTDNGLHWQPLTVAGNGPLTATIANQSTDDGSAALQAGQQYQLRIHASSNAGKGQDSQTFTVGVPNPGAPAAPGSVVAAPSGASNVTVDFTRPDPGTSTILKYQYSTDDGGTWKDTATTGDAQQHAELTVQSGNQSPLPRGGTFRVRVRAVNTEGAGLSSAAAEVSLPAAAPGAPFNLAVTPRAQGGFTLNFGRPSDNGSEISSWEYTTDNGAHWRPLTGVTGDWQRTAAITDQSTGDGTTPLAGGETYQVRVHAVNGIGTGQDSQTVSASLPGAGSPEAPTVLAAVPGPNGDRIKVDLDAPDEGSSEIIKYQYSTDDGSTWSDATTTGDAPVHTDLLSESGTGYKIYPGRPYQVRIRAVNTQGPGLPSAASEVTLPPTAPGRPYQLAVVPREQGGFTISFDNTPDNGSPLTGFEYSTDNGASWRTLAGVTGDMRRTATVLNQSTGDGTTPLAGGNSYQVRVHARNILGAGENSDTVTAELPNAGSPAAPGSVTAAPAANNGIGVDFALPGPGNTAIIKYQYSTDDGATWKDTATTGAGPLHADLTGESNGSFSFGRGKAYRVRVRAVNTQGPGMPSAAAEVSLPPSQPGEPYELRAHPGAGSFTFDFRMASDNGSPITSWEYTTDNGAMWQPLTGVTGDWQRTATVTKRSTGDGTTPLAAGATYQIRVRAINAIGTGQDSETVTASLPDAGSPAASGSVTATPSANNGIGVDFAVPGPGNTAIIKYQYSTDDGNTWNDTTTTGTGPLHADLTVESNGEFPFAHGNTYRVRVRAVNTQGPGLPSAAAEVVLPPSAPGEPFDLRALPGAGSMTLSFKAPTNNGREITAWQYTTDNGAHWRSLTGITGDDWQLTATITKESTGDGTTPLAAGATYQIRVRAINEIGTGPDSQTAPGALPNVGSPAAPGSVTAGLAGDTIEVSFTAPGPGDTPILKYQYSTDDGWSWSDVVTTGAGPFDADITVDSRDGYPLHPGEPYRVRVRAVNTQGPGLPSAAAEIGLPPTAPAGPYDVHGDPGDRTIALKWKAPDNGDKITGHAYSTDNGTSWQPLSPFAFSNGFTTASILNTSTGDGSARLQNGQTYQVRLRATNSLGTGPDSEPIAVHLPMAGSPGRPTDLALSPLGDTIGVDVTAPGQGDTAIIKYQYSTDDGSTWSDLTTTGTGSLHAAISVESNGGFPLGHDNRYAVRVRAVNTQGAGLPSAAAETSLPASKPGSPTGITPVPGNRQVTFTFSVADNGRDLTGIDYSTDNGATWKALNVDDVTQLDKMTFSTTVTNVSSGGGTARLANGVTYQLRLRATNELGTGTANDAVSFIPAADLAGAPSQILATPGDRKITVTYQVADDGGSPVTGLRYSTDGGTTWADVTPTGTGTLTAVISKQSTGGGTVPLVNGVAVSVRVRLLSSAGAGAPSAATTVTPFTVPDAPSGLTAKAIKGGGSLDFTEPGTGGSPITGYDYSTDGGTTWAAVSPSGAGTLNATITTASAAGRPALANGTTYQVAVRARNVAGVGAASSATALAVSGTAGAPVSLTAAPRNHAAVLTFNAPADTGGGPITGYEVSTDGASWAGLSTEGTGALTATLANLVNDKAYQIRVRAVTAAGPGAEAGPASVTPLAAPAAPSGVVATAKTATITVTWVASPAGGAPITGYTAFASPGPAICDTTGATTCVLGAQADQPYTITVVAHSASGDSSSSGPSDSVTAQSPVIPQTPPVTDEKLDQPQGDDSTTAPGETMTIKGSGYAPNSTVELIVYSSPISLGTVVTDDNGEFSVDVIVPASLPVGDHAIAAVGADPDGNVRAMRLDVTVAPAVAVTPTTPATPTTRPSLAITGGATADVAEAGLLMLLLGAGLVRASRTRRWHPRHRNVSPR